MCGTELVLVVAGIVCFGSGAVRLPGGDLETVWQNTNIL